MYTILNKKYFTPRILRDIFSIDMENGACPSNIDIKSQSITKSTEVIFSVNDILESNDFGKLETSRFFNYIRFISDISIHKNKRKLTPVEVSQLEKFLLFMYNNPTEEELVKEYLLSTKGDIRSYSTFRRECDKLLNAHHSDGLKFSIEQLHRVRTRGFLGSISSFEAGVNHHASKLHIDEVFVSE